MRRVLGRVAAPVVGILALLLVVAVVPLRDRCQAPTDEVTRVTGPAGAATSASGSVERNADGSCIFHGGRARGVADQSLPPATCATLRCEPGLLSVLAHARLGVLALLALVTLGATFLAALRWYSVLVLAGFRRSVLWTWRAGLAAQAGALLLPGGIGGDAVRFGLTLGARDGEGAGAGAGVDGAATPNVPPVKTLAASTLAATVLLDRLLGLVSLTTLGGTLAAIFGGSDDGTGRVLYVLFALPLLFFAGLALVRTDAFAGLGVFRTNLGAKLVPVLDYVRSPGAPAAVARGLLASLVFSGVQLGVIRGIVFALGAPVASERWIFLGGAMGLLVAGLPGLPGGWGTADAAYVFFLARAGLPASTSLAVCLLNRIFYYGVAVVGAGVLLGQSVQSPSRGRARAQERP